MKGKFLVLMLILSLPALLLWGRDFSEYAVGAGVDKYPELVFSMEHNSIRVFTAPSDSTEFCGICAPELKVVADSSGRIISKLLTLRDKNELEALQVLSVWNAGVKKAFGNPKSMVVDGRPIENKKMFDKELAEFFKSGESFDIVFPGESAANIVGLKRIEIDSEVRYDISVFIAN